MAFGVEELRVLRRALALALHPTPSPASAEDVQDCLRLAESLDEAMREGARLRAFLMADLARYRNALPGTVAGYLTLLDEVLSTGYHPTSDDLTALRTLRGNPAATALLNRCEARSAAAHKADPASPVTPAAPAAPVIPASRTPLLALPGGRAATDSGQDPQRPDKKPAEKPAAPKPSPGPAPTPTPTPKPARRPIPTPGEVFPRRKPTPPPTDTTPQPPPSRPLATLDPWTTSPRSCPRSSWPSSSSA